MILMKHFLKNSQKPLNFLKKEENYRKINFLRKNHKFNDKICEFYFYFHLKSHLVAIIFHSLLSFPLCTQQAVCGMCLWRIYECKSEIRRWQA